MSSRIKAGNIVILDGMRGAGTTTQYAHLETVYPRAFFAAEPRISSYKRVIEDLVMNPEKAAEGIQLHQFDYISRAFERYTQDVILKEVYRGRNVICEGLDSAVLAYHIYGTGSEKMEEIFIERRKDGVGDLLNHYDVHYFIFMINPEEGLNRVAERTRGNYSFTKKHIYFAEKLEMGYKRFAELYPMNATLIDVNGKTMQEVRYELRDLASIFLGEKYILPPNYDDL